MNYNSDMIKVYPTSLRASKADYESRFNTEKNITSMVNRLSSIKSFVIDGIIDNNPLEETPTVQTGIININGYIFYLNSTLSLTKAPSKDDYLAFKITIKNNEEGAYKFTQLDGVDSDEDKGTYSGLVLDYFTDIVDTATEKYLPIAKYNGTSWEILNCTLKYDAKDLKVNFEDNSKITNKELQKEADIQSWLADSFIIDDGELN